MDDVSRNPRSSERQELEKALSALPPDSPARQPLMEALKALNSTAPAVPATSVASSAAQGASSARGRLSGGAKALVGTVVALAVGVVIYFGQTEVVPNVVDEERSFAAGALRSAGFDIAVQTRPDGDVREGHVLEQSPSGGTRVRKGSEVALVVSELPRFTLTGSFTLFAQTDGPASDCYGRGGYSDITSGVSVTVRDGASAILATGSLGNGQRSATGGSCTYTFTIRDVKQADFYSIEVGRRGALSYSFAEMNSRNWTVAFSLGG